MGKGQSSIEFLADYGWMALVVAVIGGTFYTQLPDPCNLEPADLGTRDVVMNQIGINNTNELVIVFESRNVEEVKLRQVELEGNESIYSNSTESLIRFSAPVKMGKAERIDGCREYNLTLVYDRGPVPAIKESTTMRIPIILQS